MTVDAIGLGLDILLTALLAGAIVLAIVVFARLRRGRVVTIFRRPVRRPAIWASALICLGVSGLLRSANIHDLPPAGWEDPIRFVDLALSVAFVVLMIISLLNPRVSRGGSR